MSALPQLEHELLIAAERRISRRRRLRLRRAGPAALLAGAALVTGAAADGWFTVEHGRSERGTYEIRSAPPGPAADVTATPNGAGQVCLELRMRGLRPSYGCGDRPDAADPLGLVIVDANVQPGRWLVYGLVDSAVATVRIGANRSIPTDAKHGLPGRYFSALVPAEDSVWIAGLDHSGEQLASVGSRKRSRAKAGSRAAARALGSVAGFAPTVRPASRWVYRGRPITEARAADLGLSCVEDETPVVRCFKTARQADDQARGG
jgi:hypothetical protein